MAVKLSTGQAIYQKTEVFDTAGNHTWTHPLPGQNIELFVEIYGGGGGGGGGTTSGIAGNDGTNGGDTSWNTGGSTIITTGGLGGASRDASNSFNFALPDVSNIRALGAAVGDNHLPDTIYGAGGFQGQGNNLTGRSGFSGEVKRFNQIVTNDINFTVGSGGAGGVTTGTTNNGTYDGGNGKAGAIIVRYNVTSTQTPVTVNLQRRDWEHFGEVAWRTAPNTANLPLVANTFTDLTIDTEVLDTGNKVTVDGGNLFTLQAGTYEFDLFIKFTGDSGDATITQLYNTSDSSIVHNFSSFSTTYAQEKHFSGIFVVSSAKTFKLQSMMSSTTQQIGNGTPFTNSTAGADDRIKFQFKWRP